MTFIYNSPINLNIPHIAFRSKTPAIAPDKMGVRDKFSTNPLYENFGNKAEIEMNARTNHRIQELLKEYKIPLKVNMNQLEQLKQGHLKDTRIVVAKIYSGLPTEIKQKINLPILQEAAMFHDFGKVLIPEKIINKNAKLNNEEQEIMRLHSEFGYELLKNKGLSPQVLNLIKYHHQTFDGNGYPQINSDYEHTLESEILYAADKYSALRERRSYKNEINHEQTLKILEEDVEKGYISKPIYEALKTII